MGNMPQHSGHFGSEGAMASHRGHLENAFFGCVLHFCLIVCSVAMATGFDVGDAK